jgi:hypothetical protein
MPSCPRRCPHPAPQSRCLLLPQRPRRCGAAGGAGLRGLRLRLQTPPPDRGLGPGRLSHWWSAGAAAGPSQSRGRHLAAPPPARRPRPPEGPPHPPRRRLRRYCCPRPRRRRRRGPAAGAAAVTTCARRSPFWRSACCCGASREADPGVHDRVGRWGLVRKSKGFMRGTARSLAGTGRVPCSTPAGSSAARASLCRCLTARPARSAWLMSR